MKDQAKQFLEEAEEHLKKAKKITMEIMDEIKIK